MEIVGLEDFFEDTPKKKEVVKVESKNEEAIDLEEENNLEKETLEEIPQPIEGIFEPEELELGQDIEDIFLLDVIYEPNTSKAQCIFYHEPSKSIYKWNDNTGHLPYLLTYMTEESLSEVSQIVKSSEFVKMEKVKKI